MIMRPRPQGDVRAKCERFILIVWPMAVVACALAFFSMNAEGAPHYQVIYRFQGGSDGFTPDAPLIADVLGNLYGTTSQGGTGSNCAPFGCGTVFQLMPPVKKGGAWKKVILHSFNLSDGDSPTVSPLVFDQAGDLFGATYSGGSANQGVVFELTPPKQKGGQWTDTTIYSFTGAGDGGSPMGVIFDSASNLYGTTLNGGQYGQQGAGTIFQLQRGNGGAWTETTLYSFMLIGDGNRPLSVVFDSKGNLFGMTTGDDTWCGPKDPVNCGWAFELEAPAQRGGAWAYKLIHTFQGYNDGSFPSFGALSFDESGNLYGMTGGTGGTGNIFDEDAEGTVFRLALPADQGDPWKGTLLHSFPRPGGIDGSGPDGGVIFDQSGDLYGTTFYGAGKGCVFRGCGSVFQLEPPSGKDASWKEVQLHAFGAGGDGASPGSALLLSHSGVLFGVTPFGGGSGCEGNGGCGTIFEITP